MKERFPSHFPDKHNRIGSELGARSLQLKVESSAQSLEAHLKQLVGGRFNAIFQIRTRFQNCDYNLREITSSMRDGGVLKSCFWKPIYFLSPYIFGHAHIWKPIFLENHIFGNPYLRKPIYLEIFKWPQLVSVQHLFCLGGGSPLVETLSKIFQNISKYFKI